MNQDRVADERYHRPVMVQEVADLFRPVREGVVVDATFGGGGHSESLRERLSEEVRIVGIDRDGDAVAHGRALGFEVIHGDFADLDSLLDGARVGAVAGVLFDFGVSSHQLDTPERGFSYHADAPLDMRMDTSTAITAADLVNGRSEAELERIISRFGEEKNARRIARAIVVNRPFATTGELAECVAAAVPARDRRTGHPARKTFQAIRIAVNDELESITAALESAIGRLEPGGRVVAISYHSLEDRIVKRRFADGARGCVCPPGLPVCGCGAEPELRLLTRGAARPTEEEISANPRARSARLRAAEKAVAA